MNLKGRYWAFVVYPESVKGDLKEELTKMGVVAAISPLHNEDYNPDGEKKKDHYHVLLEYEGPTSYKVVNESICEPLGATIPKRVVSLRGYYRYLTHMDNPEKAQYNESEIIKIGGFNLDLTASEVTTIKIKIMQDINDNDISEYSDLINYYLYEIGDIERLEIASNNTFFFDKYLSSRRNKANKSSNVGLHNIHYAKCILSIF